MKLLVLAALLALASMLAPPSWASSPGRLQFTGSLGAMAAHQAEPLTVPVVSQYQGLATDNVNCGPAGVASLLRYLKPEQATLSDAELVQAVRTHSGEPDGDTDLAGLARALGAFNVPATTLGADDAPGDGHDPLAAIDYVLAHGRPVLVLVNGADLGRGYRYGGHFLVVTGLDRRVGTVTLMDPDTQQPRTDAWLPGGTQVIPAWLLLTAIRDSGAAGGMAALVVDAARAPGSGPITLPALIAATLALAALLVWAYQACLVLVRRRGARTEYV